MMDETADDDALYVRDLMTDDPVVIDPDVSVERVMGLMQEAAIRHVPVVDEAGILGVISDRDLAFLHGVPGVFDKVGEGDVRALLEAPVGVVMKSRFLVERDVVSVGGDEPLKRAVDTMLANRLRALPVVGDDENVVGVLSAVDVLRWVSDEALAGS